MQIARLHWQARIEVYSSAFAKAILPSSVPMRGWSQTLT